MRVPEVLAVVGAARPTLYQWMRRGMFPRPLKLSGQMVAWREAEVREWLASRTRALGGTSAADEIGAPKSKLRATMTMASSRPPRSESEPRMRDDRNGDDSTHASPPPSPEPHP